MTEIQEINQDLKTNAAMIAFTNVAATEEWRDAEIDNLRERIDALTTEVADIQRKHTEAPATLAGLLRRREQLQRSRRVNTDAAVRQLLKLSKQVEELTDVDAS